MAGERSNLEDDYFVIIQRFRRSRIRSRNRWTWEIRRRSKPLSTKNDTDAFATPQDAKLAGEKALKGLLDSLTQKMR
jgi:hypothetical protein